MEYRSLGRSGLLVSVLTLGTMTFGGKGNFAKVGNLDETGARRMVDMAFDAGINLFDTADVYSLGVSEEILGATLKGRRDKAVIATKARFRMGPGPNDVGLSRQHLIQGCEASLRRLGVDCIDLFQLHQWDGETPVEETVGALEDLVRAGKIRYVGISNFSGWHLMKFLAAAGHGVARPICQQIHYTLQSREAEYELLPATIDQGLGVMVWSPLAGGLLSGKYRRGQPAPEGTRQLAQWGEPPVRDEAKLYDIVEVVVDIATARGVSPAEVALAWLRERPGITTLIVGARTEEQLATNLKSADLVLNGEERGRLDDISLPPLIYPYWHQRRTASDRLSAADLLLIGPHMVG